MYRLNLPISFTCNYIKMNWLFLYRVKNEIGETIALQIGCIHKCVDTSLFSKQGTKLQKKLRNKIKYMHYGSIKFVLTVLNDNLSIQTKCTKLSKTHLCTVKN